MSFSCILAKPLRWLFALQSTKLGHVVGGSVSLPAPAIFDQLNSRERWDEILVMNLLDWISWERGRRVGRQALTTAMEVSGIVR